MIARIIKSSTHREFRGYYSSIGIALTLMMGLLQFISLHDAGRAIDRQIFHPVVFKLRELVNPGSLDPRIKIFAYDDRTAAHENGGFLPLKDWAAAIRSIASIPDTHIMIDKLFDFPEAGAKIADFKPIPEDAKTVRLGAITFASTKTISFRQEIPADLVAKNETLVFGKSPASSPPQTNPYVFYGAQRDIIKAFSVFGHANYAGDNYITPFIRGASGHVAHLALAIAGDLNIDDHQLKIRGQVIPRNHSGNVLVNFRDPALYRSNAVTFLSVIERSRRGLPIEIVKPGDYVVILPAMYTGHTDFVSSPFGPIPGGFHMAAMLDSVLTNRWIREIDDPGYFVIAGALVGLVLGLGLSLSVSIFGIIIAMIGVALVSILLFALFDLAVSFPLPSLAILFSGLGGALIRGHMTSIENYRRSREVAVAGLVQQSFFPKLTADLSQPTSCAVYGRFAPSSECGGDWWGTFKKGGYTYVMLGDATGHGFPAALVTSISYAVTKSIQSELDRSGTPLNPSDILHELNEILCSMDSQHSQMTFLVFRIHESSGDCLYANAGNQPALLIDPEDALKGEKPRALTALGNILGIQKDQSFADQPIQFKPGSKVILFSDGVFENRDASERKQLGKKWLRDMIQRHGMLNGVAFIDTLWNSYQEAIGYTPPDDDATLVVIEFLPST
jgi:serine phosphatase RsbU (regulator of sigma subunit)